MGEMMSAVFAQLFYHIITVKLPMSWDLTATNSTAMPSADEWDATVTLDVLWDAIENVVTRARLRAAVANIHQILLPDADPDGEWRSEFGATTDAAPVLDALKALPALLERSERYDAGSGQIAFAISHIESLESPWESPLILLGELSDGHVL
jgi:hypothetical protein